MKIHSISIENFRGIKCARVLFPDHAVLIGDNNTGKSTVLEAIDLVLGPDRLNRNPPVDEHDFWQGNYIATPIEGDSPSQYEAPKIRIEVTIIHLSDEQKNRFGGYVEWLNVQTGDFYTEANPAGVDADSILAALRVTFIGRYADEEDDFLGNTYFTRSMEEDDQPATFSKMDKRLCGYLYLRSLRTGSRALSLDHGSLLDIILRLKEIRPKMWEAAIDLLDGFDVASDPSVGISGVLESINTSLKKYVPQEWGAKPHLKVSSLTREHLRKIVTAFIATGNGNHAAPFYRQGTGTINMLVLAMLSQIAEDKQNVIFAMEEVETAIPPYAQKRIVHELRKLSAQSILTSHSPYVLEEFGLDHTVILSRSDEGVLERSMITLPDSIKKKRYRNEFRTRFCEGLLARRVLVAEGATEAGTFSVAARRLAELNPNKYVSLEALGICIIDAGGEKQIADLASLYKNLRKNVFAVCDRQANITKEAIEAQVDLLFMHEEKGIEDLVLKNTTHDALRRFAGNLNWPQNILSRFPDPTTQFADAISEYFRSSKGNLAIADFIAQCYEEEIPSWIRDTCIRLRNYCDPQPPSIEVPAALTDPLSDNL